MRERMKIPVSEMRKAAKARGSAEAEAGGVVRLSVMVASGCPAALARAVRAGLRPAKAGGRLHVEAFGAHLPAANALSDAAVVLVGEGSDLARASELALAYAQAGVPVVVGGLFADAAAAQAAEQELVDGGVSEDDLYCGLVPDDVVAALGGWLVRELPEDQAAAAAANFACCRRARARALIAEATSSNALVALLGFVPGADLPAMTLQQVSLALRLAAVYDQPLDARRARELAAVVAGAFGMRGAARALARLLPVPGVLVRLGVGAGGTYAVGQALAAYFEALGEEGEGTREGEPQAGEERR